MGVIIVGAWRGAAALTTYVLAGLAGLPVFAGAILAVGVVPFLLGGLIKAGLAALTIPGAWGLVCEVDADKRDIV